MPGERLSMRKVREVLRLKYACGASVRTIARSVGIGRTTVGEYRWSAGALERKRCGDRTLLRGGTGRDDLSGFGRSICA